MGRFVGGGYFFYAVIVASDIGPGSRVLASWWTPLAILIVFVPGWLLFAVSFTPRLDRLTTTVLPLFCGAGYLVAIGTWWSAWSGGHTTGNFGTWLVAFPGLAALSLVVTSWPWMSMVHLAVATTAVQIAHGLARPVELGPVSIPDIVWSIAFSALFVLAGIMAVRTGDLLDVSKERRVELARATAAQQAQEGERRLFDRLVHDKVLALMRNAHRANHDVRVREQASNLLRDWASMSTNEGSTHPVDSRQVLMVIRLAVADADPAVAVASPDPSSVSDASPVVPMRVANALAGAAGEAVRNARRHAGTDTVVEVTARLDAEPIRVTVNDDGAGFDVRAVSDGSLGIAKSIVARMDDVGGCARVHSEPGGGTSVELVWPR